MRLAAATIPHRYERLELGVIDELAEMFEK
jgi:hypothetical protein